MSLTTYKILAALMIFSISIIALAYPLRKKNQHHHAHSLELGEAFASGIFLGAAFFHLLPESIEGFSKYFGHHLPVAEFVCIAGFVIMLLLERISIIHAKCHPRHTIPYVLAIILILHAFIEGATLGLGGTTSEALLLFIAIAAHKGSESFALCLTLLRYELPKWELLLFIGVFALMTPFGIALGTQFDLIQNSQFHDLLTASFKAFAAGTFLYISTLHHIRFHPSTEEHQGLLEFCFLTLGLILMGGLAFWV